MAVELSQRFAVDGVELAWGEWGDGTPPLVLCHGYSGSAHDFALQVEQLATDRRVIAMDHRGHGRSTKVGSLAGYSLDRLAADLVELIEAVAGGPVDLLGHSMGGQIALRVALARPDLLRSLVLMDTSGWSFVPEGETAAMISGFLATYDPADGPPDISALAGPEDALIEATTPETWRKRKEELMAGFDPYALKSLGEELFEPARMTVRARLGEISCPVTVIVGSNDHPLCDQAADLARETRGAVAVIDGGYHSPQLTHAEDWRRAVEAHLERVAAAPVYHLALRGDWEAAVAAGAPYRRSTIGASLEEVGFIHCSLAEQVQATADRFYRGRDDVVLLRIDPSRVGSTVRLENLDGGDELFPHLYGPVPLSAVTEVVPVPPDGEGRLQVTSAL
jgi:pimeloyl-ACP methyl ester carboxylesterase/uncharacterized protein (DUF952 family)